ncbi:uncharacterized [Tachysurus ichikawai]
MKPARSGLCLLSPEFAPNLSGPLRHELREPPGPREGTSGFAVARAAGHRDARDKLFFPKNRLVVARAATHFPEFGPNRPETVRSGRVTPRAPESRMIAEQDEAGSDRAKRRLGF